MTRYESRILPSTESNVYIAGVGSSPLFSEDWTVKEYISALISAGSKALLDSGLTYDDVTTALKPANNGSFHAGDMQQAFQAFDFTGVGLNAAKDASVFSSAFDFVRSQGSRCLLAIAPEQSTATAIVLVSEDFLWSRPYLKDSAAFIQELKPPPSKQSVKEETLHGLCRPVWELRGWIPSQGASERPERMQYQARPDRAFELSRADGNAIPQWKDVEYKQDGKHRLGYNPAEQTKDISQEDFEAVRAYKHSTAGMGTRFPSRGHTAALARL